MRNKNKRKVLTMKGTKSPFLDFQEIYVVGKPTSDGAYTIELGPYVGDINIKSFKVIFRSPEGHKRFQTLILELKSLDTFFFPSHQCYSSWRIGCS